MLIRFIYIYSLFRQSINYPVFLVCGNMSQKNTNDEERRSLNSALTDLHLAANREIAIYENPPMYNNKLLDVELKTLSRPNYLLCTVGVNIDVFMTCNLYLDEQLFEDYGFKMQIEKIVKNNENGDIIEIRRFNIGFGYNVTNTVYYCKNLNQDMTNTVQLLNMVKSFVVQEAFKMSEGAIKLQYQEDFHCYCEY
ncbi:orf113 [Artaxa digramma nucleopolyhedrovirus]|uniref:Orf113 n=1 Tax=Artaxa digramma nucleopolyhedrovirus TaxID=3070910 RepID=A0AAE6UZU3_9ABAC|nr:orf113 [Euproctis digramma nucleopolyhedrovirus]QHB21772.1 orf113 [Artaxa digramma nucleopolyhedrovirus]